VKALQILFILFSLRTYAEAPYLYFNSISSQNGLSHNKVNCILQDKRGFIWLGTDDGLNRYDGQYFIVFRHEPGNTSSISGNIITSLLEDKAGILWITTADGGLSKYDYRLPPKEQFKQYKHIEGDSTTIPVNILNSVLEDKYGYLWLGTSGAYILRFNKKTERFESPVHKGTRTVTAMCLDKDGNIWAGRIGGSFFTINTSTLEYEMDDRYNDLYANLPHASITSMYRDDEDNIWFGSWDNLLYRYNLKTKQEEGFKKDNTEWAFPNDEVQSIAADNNGRLWMAGRYYGLTIYDKHQKKFFNYRYNAALEGTIADDHVNCVYIDRTGIVWLGTNKGISIYNPSQQFFEQTFLTHQNNDITIYDFYKDEKNKLWLATSEGIFIQEPGTKNFQSKKIIYNGQKLSVTKFFKDDDGIFYLGTNYSLFVYDPVTNNVSLLRNTEKDKVMNGIIDSRVVSVIRDTIEDHPVLLVSPYGHYITYYDLVDKNWVSRTDSVKDIIHRFNLKDNLIRKFYRTADGHVWFAMSKYGLGAWQKHSMPSVNYFSNNPANEKSISSDNVYDISEDSKGNLWISTLGGGLNYLDIATKKFTHISATNNLLEGIQTDNNGNVWIIGNGNLHKYDVALKTYSTFVLPDLEKSGGVKGNIYKDNDGNMYVAGINYFIKFNPSEIKETSTQSKVYFTDFKIFNNSFSDLLETKNIRLSYSQNYFTIEFAAPEFDGSSIQYSYILAGIDKQWTDAGNRNFANYSNLPAGNYIFKVRANNKKGTTDTEVASLNITIIPPFWERWWFYTLCAAVIVSATYAMYRYRINELLKRHAIRNKIAQDLHDNMGSTLTSISVYSQVAKIYHQQHKEEQLHQTLEKIGTTSGEMISEMNDIVWTINPRHDHMSTIIQRMESFARPLLQTRNIALSFNYDESILDLNLQMEKRKNFYLIFKEAINNALKYSCCKTIDVAVKHDHSSIELIVKDDGVGFDADKINTQTSRSLAGNGLKNMKMRAAEMKASFKITSMPGKGTSILLLFHIP
jgi:ligand-binding sensor domain-containing protein/signal transduction histidine kinase